MKLVPMSESDYGFWKSRSLLLYAADKMRANGVDKETAETIARDDFERNLPNGLNSKNSFLYTAKDGSGNVLGFIWLLVRGPENDRRAFIGDVIVEEQYRGKGYGRKIMELLEDEVSKQGLRRIGLHVFGYNEPAIQLYQSLGYTTTDLVMEKRLST